MKTIKILIIGVAAVVTLTATQSLRAGDDTSTPAKLIQNHALAHSPRMIELYPELAWAGVASTAAAKPDARAIRLAEVSKNIALASSPRMREQFPELAVSGQTSAAISAKPAASTSELAAVMKNQSLANSPRMKERFPELRLNNGFDSNLKSVEIAPLK
ncbi:MAG: hypothetical protein PHY43_10140 [Verrucomicrobiales bacterium]|nr:hypothetical protein [Verrucomicrobiales bacterium]